jgi:hypothetical protein
MNVKRIVAVVATAVWLSLGIGVASAAPAPDAASNGAGRDSVVVDGCTPDDGQFTARGRVVNRSDGDLSYEFDVLFATEVGTVVARSSTTVDVAAGETEPWSTSADTSGVAVRCVIGDVTGEATDVAGAGAAAWGGWRLAAVVALGLVGVFALVSAVSPHRGRRRRASRWRPAGLSVVSVVAIAALIGTAPLGAAQTTHGDVLALRDMDGNVVVADRGSVPTATELGQMDLVDDIGQRVQVPAVGLDVPLGEVNEVGNIVRPPGFTAAYMVRNRGVGLDDAAQGTVYVAMHSVRDGRAPGNYLIDVEAGAPTVKAGDTVKVADLVYRVESAELIPKTELSSVDRLWTNEPGRMVIVTCLQRTEGRSLQNLVVVAALEG